MPKQETSNSQREKSKERSLKQPKRPGAFSVLADKMGFGKRWEKEVAYLEDLDRLEQQRGQVDKDVKTPERAVEVAKTIVQDVSSQASAEAGETSAHVRGAEAAVAEDTAAGVQVKDLKEEAADLSQEIKTLRQKFVDSMARLLSFLRRGRTVELETDSSSSVAEASEQEDDADTLGLDRTQESEEPPASLAGAGSEITENRVSAATEKKQEKITLGNREFEVGQLVKYITLKGKEREYVVVGQSKDKNPGLILREPNSRQEFAISAKALGRVEATSVHGRTDTESATEKREGEVTKSNIYNLDGTKAVRAYADGRVEEVPIEGEDDEEVFELTNEIIVDEEPELPARKQVGAELPKSTRDNEILLTSDMRDPDFDESLPVRKRLANELPGTSESPYGWSPAAPGEHIESVEELQGNKMMQLLQDKPSYTKWTKEERQAVQAWDYKIFRSQVERGLDEVAAKMEEIGNNNPMEMLKFLSDYLSAEQLAQYGVQNGDDLMNKLSMATDEGTRNKLLSDISKDLSTLFHPDSQVFGQIRDEYLGKKGKHPVQEKMNAAYAIMRKIISELKREPFVEAPQRKDVKKAA